MSAKWGDRMAARQKQKYGTKTDNTPAAHKAKVEIRELVLEAIGCEQARVFDAFAGEGMLWRAVWHRAADYIGAELRFLRDDPRPLYCCKNERVLRCIDLQPWNVYDLDAYGAPWEQATIIAARRKVSPGERIGMVLTDGTTLSMLMGTLPTPMAFLAGFKTKRLPGVIKSRDELLTRCILGMCKRMNCSIVSRWQANSTLGARMNYIGLVLEGNREPPLVGDAPF